MIDSSGDVVLIEDRDLSDKSFKAHGIIMYTAWSVISLIQITLNRYLRHQWRWKQLAHTILGTFTILMTSFGAYLSIKQEGIEVKNNPHSQLAYITLGLVGFLGIMGLTSVILRSGYCCNMDWNTQRILLITKLHKYVAYFTIVFSQATVSSGVMTYFTYNNKQSEGYEIISGINFLFYTIWIIAEVLYRLKQRKEVEFEAEDDL